MTKFKYFAASLTLLFVVSFALVSFTSSAGAKKQTSKASGSKIIETKKEKCLMYEAKYTKRYFTIWFEGRAKKNHFQVTKIFYNFHKDYRDKSNINIYSGGVKIWKSPDSMIGSGTREKYPRNKKERLSDPNFPFNLPYWTKSGKGKREIYVKAIGDALLGDNPCEIRFYTKDIV